MRGLLIGLAALIWVSLLNVWTPASAETYPVCLAGGPDNTLRCDYANLEQCKATAAGGLGYCVSNPGYISNACMSYRGACKRIH